MANYVGVDYGTSMIKAAVCESADAGPVTLRLESPGPFLPAAVGCSAGNQQGLVGMQAYQRRVRSDAGVAHGFRDAVVSPGSEWRVKGQSISGDSLQTQLLRYLFSRLGAVVSGAVDGLTFAVPSHWSGKRWSLPVALSSCQVRPSLFVREWAAALASRDSAQEEQVLLLSLGYGSAHAAACVCSGEEWQLLGCHADSDAGSATLRQRLLNQIADEAAKAARKDPLADDDAYMALQGGLDCAVQQLLTQPEGRIRARIGTVDFDRPLSHDEIATIAEPLREKLERLLKATLSKLGNRDTCHVVAWGELALLLPLNAWLEQSLPHNSGVEILPLDAIAAGSARLSAAFTQRRLGLPNDRFCSVSLEDGEYTSTPPSDAGKVHCLELLPGVFAPTLERKTAFLTLRLLSGKEERRPITSDRFRLGRDPASDWVFDFAAFPTVSGSHAAIVREGTEYSIKDLSSSNGTFLNDCEVRDRHRLEDGDVIGLGLKGPKLTFEH